MIQAFKIVNYLGESLYLDIRRPEDTGLLVTSVTGLTPPKADIATSQYALFDGSAFVNGRAEQRNIVMNIVFYMDNNEKLSIEEIRHRCYRYFPLRKELTFYAINESGTYYIKGYVETNEINIFSKQEATQISIICPDPNFKKEGSEQYPYVSIVEPTFQFPAEFKIVDDFYNIWPSNWNSAGGSTAYVPVQYELDGYKYSKDVDLYTTEYNEFGQEVHFIEHVYLYDGDNDDYDSIDNSAGGTEVIMSVESQTELREFNDPPHLARATYRQETHEFGKIKEYPRTIVTYNGSDDTGIGITITVIRPITGQLRINNVTRNETMILDLNKVRSIVGSYPQKFDDILINTEKGHKSATLIRGNVKYNILHAVDLSSKWIQIQQGDNEFTYTITNGSDNATVRLDFITSVLGV